MNKIITLYELLGLVKDGKAPKNIKYNEFDCIYDKKHNDYYILDCVEYLFADNNIGWFIKWHNKK